jgi:hypothetical protein
MKVKRGEEKRENRETRTHHILDYPCVLPGVFQVSEDPLPAVAPETGQG